MHRLQQVEEIFSEIAELPAARREGRLAELCGGDGDLLREVAGLLAARTEASRFLERSVATVSAAWVGRRLGPYRLTAQVGEGGMSTVFAAIRGEVYEQRVAVKVFDHNPRRRDLVQRFQAERQILAALEHPGIARLLDGGTTDEGFPYLVLEWIDGLPLDRYCALHQPSVGRRLELIEQVAAAVSHAHRHLIVHRDLKPSNILVTAEGVPKLLDFGIAKLLAGTPVAVAAGETTLGHRLMTPHFASPEQVTGGPITTATDVYSLGVLLHVVLTGRLPYRAAPGSLGAIERAIVEEEPERPSAAVPPPLSRRLAGDLDNIVQKALAKEPERRYTSIELLAEDLRRHRQGLPVAARPATLGYRWRKFVGRHRLGVGLGAAALLAILGLAVATALAARRLERQRDRAVRSAQFWNQLLSASESRQDRGEATTLRQLLDQGAARIPLDFAGEPEVEAELAHDFGVLYNNRGLGRPARPLLERSLALQRQLHGEIHPEAVGALMSLGTAQNLSGDWAAAEQSFRHALALGERLPELDPRIKAHGLNELALVLAEHGQPKTAEGLFERALALYRQPPESRGDEVPTILGSLGVLRQGRGDLAGAEAAYREAIGQLRRRFGPIHPKIAIQLNNLATLQYHRLQFAAAESSFRAALAMHLQIHGTDHADVATDQDNLCMVLVARGRYGEAEPLCRDALAARRRLLGKAHPDVLLSRLHGGILLYERGDLAAARRTLEAVLAVQRRAPGADPEMTADLLGWIARLESPAAAEPLLREAYRIRRQALGDDPGLGGALAELGSVRAALGAPAEGEALMRQGLAMLRTLRVEDHWPLARAKSELGHSLAVQGKWAEAEPLLLSGYRSLCQFRGPAAETTRLARERLIAFYEARGDRAKATLYRSQRPSGAQLAARQPRPAESRRPRERARSATAGAVPRRRELGGSMAGVATAAAGSPPAQASRPRSMARVP